MRARYLLLYLTIGVIVLASADVGVGQGVVDREYDIKAAYLYQFGNYVEWPKNSAAGNDTFVIGVLGPDSFGAVLDTIAANKTVQGKKIVIRRFASAKDYEPCHMMFVSQGADANADEPNHAARVKAAVAKTKGQGVLLVTDTDGMAPSGMMIGFFIEDNRIKLEISPKAASKAGLTISSRLLGLQVVRLVTSALNSHELEKYARLS